MKNDLNKLPLSELHPRAERLILGSGDASLVNELLNEALTSFLSSSCNANHGAGASTQTQNNPRINPPRLPFYVGLVVFTTTDLSNPDHIRDYPIVIEHNPEEGG